jgi:K+-dependent Na+/Ca+ exchanger-like protein
MVLLGSLLTIAATFYILYDVVENYFIKSLDNIADWMKLPPSVSGATLLALGTSAPEISTALVALFVAGSNPATGVGTIVGSAIFQILVVIGFAALVQTSYLDWRPVVRDSVVYGFALAILLFVLQDQRLTATEGFLLVGFYLVYLFILFLWTRFVDEGNGDNSLEMSSQEDPEEDDDPQGILKFWWYLTWPIRKILSVIPDANKHPKTTVPVFILCLAIIGIACFFMVQAAETLAQELGISEVIIALTILAGGTSVPEMVSSAVVSRQGRGDMAIANAIGSNIFDILVSLGLPVLIFTLWRGPIENLGAENINSSLALLGVTLIGVVFLLISTRFKATRWFGLTLITLYVAYVFAAYSGVI